MNILLRNALNLIAEDAALIAKRKGFKLGSNVEAFALMHSEISEAVEADRIGNPPSENITEYSSIEEEMADVIIRVLGFARLREMDIGGAVAAKMEFNKGRPMNHGNKNY